MPEARSSLDILYKYPWQHQIIETQDFLTPARQIYASPDHPNHIYQLLANILAPPSQQIGRHCATLSEFPDEFRKNNSPLSFSLKFARNFSWGCCIKSEFLCRINWTLNLRSEHFRQQKIKYGAVQGGSTAAFFRVRKHFTRTSVDKLLLSFGLL